jgi:hypothetical protein
MLGQPLGCDSFAKLFLHAASGGLDTQLQFLVAIGQHPYSRTGNRRSCS